MAKILQDAFEAMNRLFGEPSETAEERYYELLDRIAIAVVEYRMEHKLSQKMLAEQLNISQAMVSKYESGDYNISLKSLVELFDRLGLNVSDLFRESSRPYERRVEEESTYMSYPWLSTETFDSDMQFDSVQIA